MAASPARAKLRHAWTRETAHALDERGYAVIPRILSQGECLELIDAYDDETSFRKTVVMARHGFGQGQYRYFADPMPEIVSNLRAELYARLSPIANTWWERLGLSERFPLSLSEYRRQLYENGQGLPTPLLLRYGIDDYNCLHQDLYGDLWFPLQATVLLARPEQDFVGGEFVLVEQRPRRQSKPIVVPLGQGDCVVFPCRFRPRMGARGYHRAEFRHGVSAVTTGLRHALGLIFHDAAS